MNDIIYIFNYYKLPYLVTHYKLSKYDDDRRTFYFNKVHLMYEEVNGEFDPLLLDEHEHTFLDELYFYLKHYG